MKKQTSAILILFFLQSLPFSAFAKSFGVGVRIGTPSGVSVKYWLDKLDALDGLFSWDLEDDKEFAFYGTYLLHQPSPLKIKLSPLDFYYGLGATIENRTIKKTNKSESTLGVRVPLGLTHHWPRPSIELFGEIGTQLELIPSTTFSIDAGVGARFYF